MKINSLLMPPLHSATFFKRFLAGAVLANLFVVALAVLWLSHSRQQDLDDDRITGQNLTQILEQYIVGLVKNADMALLTVADDFERQRQPAGASFDETALNRLLAQQQAHLPALESLRLADARGQVRYGRGVDLASQVNIADRDYFISARDDAKSGLVFSKPLLARISKKWAIVFARRVNRRDGSFAGVVYANLALDHLTRAFSGINVGAHGAVTLRDGELGIIARYPEPEGVGSTVANKVVSPRFREMVAAGLPAGTFRVRAGIDHIERTFSYRKAGDYPLYVIVGIATDDSLAGWRDEALSVAALVACFLLVTLFSARLLFNAWQQHVASTEELLLQEEKFHTVADFTYDWEYWLGPDNREILYMTPSCERVTGYAAGEFVADPELLQRIVHADDRPQLAEHLEHYLDNAEQALDFRIVRRDGGIRWIAHGCQPVYDKQGRFRGRRVSNRDITERKLSEAQVQQLAYYDTLTKLPNRRMLLDRLAQAMSQARRYERSLAVMFLDLDNFKRVNDTLGHDVGDELLKEVSARLSTCVRRGDTVARQGGDEFIVVLAEIVHPDDAALVADKIIKTLGEPVCVLDRTLNVTTSIGIAVHPINGDDDVQELMKKADMAMYAAKEAGRNGYRFFVD